MNLPVPAGVRAPVLAWLAAVAAGVAETAVRLLTLDPPDGGSVLVRALVYVAVVGLVLALSTGREVVRWLLAVLLGGVGTLSLVVEPISWWAGGGSASAFLLSADAPSLAAAALRAVHGVAVVVAMVLMFGPRANAFVAASRRA